MFQFLFSLRLFEHLIAITFIIGRRWIFEFALCLEIVGQFFVQLGCIRFHLAFERGRCNKNWIELFFDNRRIIRHFSIIRITFICWMWQQCFGSLCSWSLHCAGRSLACHRCCLIWTTFIATLSWLLGLPNSFACVLSFGLWYNRRRWQLV